MRIELASNKSYIWSMKKKNYSWIFKPGNKFFGHLIRANGKQRELLEGHIEGKRGRGRKRRDWMKDTRLCTQDNYVNCVKKANDRTLWRAMVVNLRQSKTAR